MSCLVDIVIGDHVENWILLVAVVADGGEAEADLRVKLFVKDEDDHMDGDQGSRIKDEDDHVDGDQGSRMRMITWMVILVMMTRVKTSVKKIRMGWK